MHLTFSHHYPEQTYAKKVFQSLPESPVSLLHIIESLKPLIQKQLFMSSQSFSWLCFIQLQCIRICVLFTSNVFVVGQFASSSPLGQSGTKLQTSWGPRHVPSFCLIFQKIIHSKNDSVRKYRQLVLSFYCNSSLTTDNAITWNYNYLTLRLPILTSMCCRVLRSGGWWLRTWENQHYHNTQRLSLKL